jgi:type IV secretion system protein VirD4
VILALALVVVFGLRIGWGDSGTSDPDRHLTISSSGSYGTAGFMTQREAERAFEVTSAGKTDQDILGAFDPRQVITLGKGSRLNSNLAICGASGTGKSRSISRNLVLQAARRGESVILTDPKSGATRS